MGPRSGFSGATLLPVDHGPLASRSKGEDIPIASVLFVGLCCGGPRKLMHPDTHSFRMKAQSFVGCASQGGTPEWPSSPSMPIKVLVLAGLGHSLISARPMLPQL